jgi:hypothetical protein
MFRLFKVSIAFFVCLAFIFKLSICNLGLFVSVNYTQNSSQIIFNSDCKDRDQGHNSVLNSTQKVDFTAAEVCEEETNDDEQFKSSVSSLFQNATSFSPKLIGAELSRTNCNGSHSVYFSLPLYLAFQVFRV